MKVLFICLILFWAKLSVAEITLSLENNQVTVSYGYYKSGTGIRFVDTNFRTHQIVREKFWESPKGCNITHDHLEVLVHDCPDLRFHLSWDDSTVDRLYPPLVQLQGGGVLIFTGYLAALDQNGPLPWIIKAPKNGVVSFRGQRSQSFLQIEGKTFHNDPRGWVYLGPDAFINSPQLSLLVENGVADEIRASLTASLPKLLAYYEHTLDARLDTKPSLYLTWLNRDRQEKSFQADTVPGNIIRFSLSGIGWSKPSAEDLDRLRAVIAHELAHFWNSGVFDSSQKSLPWLHEGNAELLSAAALRATGIASAAATIARVNNALEECTWLARGRAWRAMEDSNRGAIPYACGFAIQFAAAAAAKKAGTYPNVIAFWRAFWKKHPRYNQNDLIAFVAEASKQTVALDALLENTESSLAVDLQALLKAAGVNSEDRTDIPKKFENKITSSMLQSLFLQFCRGPIEFVIWEDHVLLGKQMKCKDIPTESKIAKIEGASLFEAASTGFSAVKRGCLSDKQSFAVTLLSGERIDIPCQAGIALKLPAVPRFFQLSPNLEIDSLLFDSH